MFDHVHSSPQTHTHPRPHPPAQLLFFGGFLFTYSAMPPWWAWYSRIDFLRYAWTAVMLNQFRVNPLWIGGKTVLGHFDIADASMWGSCSMLLVFFAVFTAGAWATLSFKRYQLR